MSPTSTREYAFISSDAAPMSPATEVVSLPQRNRRSIMVALVVSGLCFAGAALVMGSACSRSQGFLRPAVAQQLQQNAIVFDEVLGVLADTVSLPIIVRDFQESHPDFENHPWNIAGYDHNVPTPGIVEDKLGIDGKPVYKGGITVASKASFDEWFNDVPGINTRVELKLDLIRSSTGTLVADHPEFFPIDHVGHLHPTLGHNYWFTLELHTAFRYHGGEKFTFRGDDDLWVFINGSLAIDLGGMHKALLKTVELDTLGLNKGQLASLDLFFAERHTIESHLRVETTIQMGEDLCMEHPHMQLGTVAHNNLGSRGPDVGLEGLVYRGSEVVPDKPLVAMELAVSVKNGSTYEPGALQNGLFGDYGFVSLKAGTEVTLQFSFRDPGTKQPVLLRTAHISFLDLDQGLLGMSSEYVEIGGHTVKVIMPHTEIREEQVADGLTRFSATTPGATIDNPRDPNLMTMQQRNRAVTLTFKDTSGVEATLGCSAGVTDCDFVFAAEPSLLCPKMVIGAGDRTPAIHTETTTTTTITSTTSTVAQGERKYCVIEVNAFNYRSMCFDKKPWWMFWK